jgi:hypothetical protein
MRTPFGNSEKDKFKEDDFVKVKEVLESMLKSVDNDLKKAKR